MQLEFLMFLAYIWDFGSWYVCGLWQYLYILQNSACKSHISKHIVGLKIRILGMTDKFSKQKINVEK
jgi:hypothetical protein